MADQVAGPDSAPDEVPRVGSDAWVRMCQRCIAAIGGVNEVVALAGRIERGIDDPDLMTDEQVQAVCALSSLQAYGLPVWVH
jgi:hypothetical protein